MRSNWYALLRWTLCLGWRAVTLTVDGGCSVMHVLYEGREIKRKQKWNGM